MGQTDSKLKGSFTFAYLKDLEEHLQHNITRSTSGGSPHATVDTPRFDNILIHPELYGLRAPPSSKAEDRSDTAVPTPTSSIETVTPLDSDITTSHINGNSNASESEKRPDSGSIHTANHEEALKLANDVAYIDNTYYPSLHFHPYTATKATKSSAASSATAAVVTGDMEKDTGVNESGVKFSFADVLSASPDKSIREVHLSNRSICQLNSNMGMLITIRKLDLSSNRLTELPESIGCMQNLEVLDVSRNRLRNLPDTIGYLSNLSELDLSYNNLDHITPCIEYLDKLKSLSLAFNQISRLPTNVEGLINLINLDLTRNPLQVLPAEIAKLPFLRRMRLDDCPLNNEMSYSTKHNPPSLVEICARHIVRNKVVDIHNVEKQQQPVPIPQHLVSYIQSAKRCSSCRGPYFESCVLRGRLMEKADIYIPLEYTLCSAHWLDCDDRILSMFSAQPESSSDNVPLPDRPMLPSIPSRPRSIFKRHHRQSNTASTTNSHSPANNTYVENSLTMITSNGNNISQQQQLTRPGFVTTTKLRSNNSTSKRTSSLGRLAFRFKRSNNLT